MKTLLFLLEKEFRQISRDTVILRLILMLPVIQLIILPLAADFEIKKINIALVDLDHSSYSRQLAGKIGASGYFRSAGECASYGEAFRLMEADRADVVLEIPAGFERTAVRDKEAPLYLAVNAINGMKANVGGMYLSRIIADFNAELRMKLMPQQRAPMQLETVTVNWFNPHLNYRIFMVPGILVLLVTMVGAFMCALNIVREKEIGTMEQINVTPIRKHHFILGKLIPFWLIGMFVFSVGLFVIGRGLYGIVPAGSILLIYTYLSIYLVAVLGMGLLISTYSNNQQQAMSLSFFFIMIFILMSGLFTSIDAMPAWAQWIAHLNPMSYFIDFMRMVVMKGSSWADVRTHFVVMAGFALVFNGWAILNYKKTS